MLNQRSQNDVRITLISRCRRCQPIFNQISTSKRRRIPAGLLVFGCCDKFVTGYHHFGNKVDGSTVLAVLPRACCH